MRQEKVSNTAPPFFELLSDADEIRVREITKSADVPLTANLKNLIKDFEENDLKDKRAFVVFVTTPPVKIAPQPTPETTLPRTYLLESADLLLKNKDYLLARNVYSFLLKQNLRDRDALKGLGICFLRLGDANSSRKCFRAYQELFQEEEAFFWLGMSEVKEANHEMASQYFKEIKHPEFLKPELQFEFHKESGNVFMRIGEPEKAEVHYRAAMNLDLNSDAIFVNLGTLAMDRKRYEAAHTHFHKALSLNPKSAKAYCGLGLTALALEQFILAEKQFEKAIECEPQNVVALSQLMKLATSDRKVETLKGKLGSFLDKDKKNSEVRYLHAACEFKLGRYLSCQKEIETLLADDASHVAARQLREELTKHLHQLGGTK